MTCPICGKELPCTHVRGSAAVLVEQGTSDVLAAAGSDPNYPAAREPNWRKEVASRVQLHRARRHKRGDDSAMELDFGPEEALAVTEEPVARGLLPRYAEKNRFFPTVGTEAAGDQRTELIIPEPPKVIRFPRQPATTPSHQVEDWSPPELTKALPEMPPRIFADTEVDAIEDVTQHDFAREISPPDRPPTAPPAEQMELLPSFDDIRLETGHITATNATEVIPRPASLQERLFAGAVDISAVVLAAVIFDLTFVQLAEDSPHSRMALLCGVGVSAALWILFQYLFLVHGSGTPGMRLAQLELASFEGKPVSSYARRCRALACTLSALSIGLGYAWALVDEDRLGWHDRITGTLVRSTHQRSTVEAELWE